MSSTPNPWEAPKPGGHAAQTPPGYPRAQGQPPPGYPPTPPQLPRPPACLADGTPLASVWKRLAAVVIDGIIVSIIIMPFAVIFMVSVLMPVMESTMSSTGPDGPAMGRFYLTWFVGYVVLGALSLIVASYFYIVRVRQVGATFGKQLLGLRIRSLRADG